MIKSSNTERDARTGPVDPAAIRPLNARSLALSALLGTHPPRLPARGLVALAELFAIAPGTMRTALSRMAANGEVRADDGRYELTGRLLDRQRAQDTGRRAPDTAWDGTWHTVVASADQRDVAERRRFRSLLADHRFGELRPDIWMRPANLPAPPPDGGLITTTGGLHGPAAADLAARLWDLDAIASSARRLLADLDDLARTADWADATTIPAAFTTSAAVLRFLRAEPLLPAELTPAEWPVDDLRARYVDVEARLQRLLHDFLGGA